MVHCVGSHVKQHHTSEEAACSPRPGLVLLRGARARCTCAPGRPERLRHEAPSWFSRLHIFLVTESLATSEGAADDRSAPLPQSLSGTVSAYLLLGLVLGKTDSAMPPLTAARCFIVLFFCQLHFPVSALDESGASEDLSTRVLYGGSRGSRPGLPGATRGTIAGEQHDVENLLGGAEQTEGHIVERKSTMGMALKRLSRTRLPGSARGIGQLLRTSGAIFVMLLFLRIVTAFVMCSNKEKAKQRGSSKSSLPDSPGHRDELCTLLGKKNRGARPGSVAMVTPSRDEKPEGRVAVPGSTLVRVAFAVLALALIVVFAAASPLASDPVSGEPATSNRKKRITVRVNGECTAGISRKICTLTFPGSSDLAVERRSDGVLIYIKLPSPYITAIERLKKKGRGVRQFERLLNKCANQTTSLWKGKTSYFYGLTVSVVLPRGVDPSVFQDPRRPPTPGPTLGGSPTQPPAGEGPTKFP